MVIEAALLACVAVVLFLAACYGMTVAERFLLSWGAARRAVRDTEAEGQDQGPRPDTSNRPGKG